MQLQYLPLVLFSVLTPLSKFNLIEDKIHFSFPMLISTESDPADNANSGTPKGQRRPGGTRPPGEPIGTCPATNKQIRAIVPENAWGLTAQDHPVFWFYIPYTEGDVNSIEFALTDANENTIYRKLIPLENTPKIVPIELPQDRESALQSNQIYQWWLAIKCEKEQGNDIDLYGWIEKISSENQSPSTIIWYDELTEKARLYRDSPHDPQVQNQWRELLENVELGDLFGEKIGEVNLNQL